MPPGAFKSDDDENNKRHTVEIVATTTTKDEVFESVVKHFEGLDATHPFVSLNVGDQVTVSFNELDYVVTDKIVTNHIDHVFITLEIKNTTST